MPSVTPHKKFMRIALAQALKGARKGEGGPFGCCITKGSRLIARAHNTVLKDKNPTAHAEINAIQRAARVLKTHNLTGCHLYTTTEPCPMCFGAIHWARIDLLIYGTDTKEVAKIGFNELALGTAKLKRLGKSNVKIKKNFLQQECRSLLRAWKTLPHKEIY